MLKASKDVAARWTEEIWNKGNLSAIEKLTSPDFVFHRNAGADYRGHAGLKEAVKYFRTAFPDGRFTITEQIAEGDKVVLRSSLEGTHKGPWAGVAGTGTHVTCTFTVTLRVVGGQVTEHWSHSDTLGFLKQVGRAPS